MTLPGRRRPFLLASLAAVTLVGLRFSGYVAGGSVVERDARFFFVPWRLQLARLIEAGDPPLWTDAMGAGRAFLANPNAAVFWPPSWIVPFAGTTALFLVHCALAALGLLWALRLGGASAWPALAGVAVLVFSGVFQALPAYFGLLGGAGAMAVAVGALLGLDPRDLAGVRRRAGVAAAALAGTFFAGEPVATATAGAAALGGSLALSALELRRGAREEARRRLVGASLCALLALLLGGALLLPAAAELSRSARGSGMKAEHGALFWSVRPTRVLTLLEPRLVGDPAAEDPGYWGSGTFDGGSPYFRDLALGLVPLVLVVAASADPRGRVTIGVACVAVLLSFGRFLPLYEETLGRLAVLRYPEKWWLLGTLALCASAAFGVEALAVGRARRRATGAALLLGGALGGLWLLSIVAPDRLRSLLWGLSLGVGDAPAAQVAGALTGDLRAGFLSAVVLGAALWASFRERIPVRVALLVAAVLFVVDAPRRVASTCPPGPAGLWEVEPPLVAAVREAAGEGRYFDDRAFEGETTLRRLRELSGFDPLQPVTGSVWGLRYAGENDVDRMTSKESVAFARRLAALPWGERKLDAWRRLGVRVVRTPETGALAGTEEIGRTGGDRILRVLEARDRHALLPEARFVPDAPSALSLLDDPSIVSGRTAVLVAEPASRPPVRGSSFGSLVFGPGDLTVLEERSHRERLRVRAGTGGALLAIARAWDPFWRASLDGQPVPLLRAEGFLSAVLIPEGEHLVELRYRNASLPAGLALTLAGLALWVALVCWRRDPGRTRARLRGAS